MAAVPADEDGGRPQAAGAMERVSSPYVTQFSGVCLRRYPYERTPEGFSLNSRGWSEERASPPGNPSDETREPRRGSPIDWSICVPPDGVTPPGWNDIYWNSQGCARSSRTPGYSWGTPPGLNEKANLSEIWRPRRCRVCGHRDRNADCASGPFRAT